ncbi:MAG TPA: hypothetical protein VG733_06725 [Chthoniobacteraceae bacterium]|nr:hypothetical protein [Chthoniobacteraceae bacterium]
MTTTGKPNRLLRAMLVVSPGAVSLAFTTFAKLFLSADNEMGASLLGVIVALPLCVAAAFVLARGHGGAWPLIGRTFVYTFLLIVLNFSIAFAGCVLMQPRMNIE